MWLRKLSLFDFRSWESASIDLEPGITVLLGDNGQGKTNLLEAAIYLSALSSHRVAHDAPLVRAGAERAAIRGIVVGAGRELLLEAQITPGKARKLAINRTTVKRIADMVGVLRTVVFSPEDLRLVTGDPATRRRFLDELLSLRAPQLAGVRADYERVLRQRTTLLKNSYHSLRNDEESALLALEVWDEQLIGLGSRLIAGRLDLLRDLAPHLAAAYAGMAGPDAAAIARYSSDSAERWDPRWGLPGSPAADPQAIAAALTSALTQVRGREIERGVTLLGPHRDDMELRLGQLPAKGYASHGEGWSLALALKIASFELLRADGGAGGGAAGQGDPVLILDDVFAELDARRRATLVAVAEGAQQVLISAAAIEDIPAHLGGRRIDVGGGALFGAELPLPEDKQI